MALHLPDDESKKPKQLILQKIPLFELLELFEHLYNNGADYVDITGVSNSEEEKDELIVSVKTTYISEEPREEIEEEEEQNLPMAFEIFKQIHKPSDGKLSIDDINELLT